MIVNCIICNQDFKINNVFVDQKCCEHLTCNVYKGISAEIYSYYMQYHEYKITVLYTGIKENINYNIINFEVFKNSKIFLVDLDSEVFIYLSGKKIKYNFDLNFIPDFKHNMLEIIACIDKANKIEKLKTFI